MRQQLDNNQSVDRIALRSSINRLTNGIQKRLSELKSAAADAVYESVTNFTDSRRTFEAVRTLKISKQPSSIGVHNEKGCLIATDAGKAAVVAKYLE